MKNADSAKAMARNAARAEAMLRQLAHAGRLMILCGLAEGEKSVGELEDITGMSQSAVSQHLTRLKDAGLVDAERRGRRIYYRLCSVPARAILSTLYLIYCPPK